MTLKNTNFRCGDVYLFHPTENGCDPASSLWGVYDRTDADGRIVLETSSHDLMHFSPRIFLSSAYFYCRPASRDELRDFSYNLGCNRL